MYYKLLITFACDLKLRRYRLDRLAVLVAEEDKAKEAGKAFDDKKFGEKTRLYEGAEALEAATAALSTRFYEEAAAVYEATGCALSAKAVPAVRDFLDAHTAYFAAAAGVFTGTPAGVARISTVIANLDADAHHAAPASADPSEPAA